MNFLLYIVCISTITSQIAAAESLPVITPDQKEKPLTFAAAHVQEYLEQRGEDLFQPPNGIVLDHKAVAEILKEVWDFQAIPNEYKTALCMLLIHGNCEHLDEVQETEGKPLSKALIAALLKRYVNFEKISDEAMSEFFFHRGLLGAKGPEGNLYVRDTSTFSFPCSFFYHFLERTIKKEQIPDVYALLQASKLSPQDYVNHTDLKPELERQIQEWLKRNKQQKLSCILPLELTCLDGLSALVPLVITRLDLSNNTFETIGSGDFKGCDQLQVLILNNCGIEKIDLSFLWNLPNLQNLSLCNNPIAQHPDTQKAIRKKAQEVLIHRTNPTIIFN